MNNVIQSNILKIKCDNVNFHWICEANGLNKYFKINLVTPN